MHPQHPLLVLLVRYSVADFQKALKRALTSRGNAKRKGYSAPTLLRWWYTRNCQLHSPKPCYWRDLYSAPHPQYKTVKLRSLLHGSINMRLQGLCVCGLLRRNLFNFFRSSKKDDRTTRARRCNAVPGGCFRLTRSAILNAYHIYHSPSSYAHPHPQHPSIATIRKIR